MVAGTDNRCYKEAVSLERGIHLAAAGPSTINDPIHPWLLRMLRRRRKSRCCFLRMSPFFKTDNNHKRRARLLWGTMNREHQARVRPWSDMTFEQAEQLLTIAGTGSPAACGRN